MTNLLAQAKTAGETTDQTEVQSGFVYEVAPAGYTTARFIGYVETGKQPQRAFEGVAKPDAPEVRLTFELNGPKHTVEYEHEGEKKTRTNTQRENIAISMNEKANFHKLLNKMIAGRSGIKHMAEMLGEGFLIKLSHNKSKDGKKTYANMKTTADGWQIGAPATTDPITNETTVLKVPEATQDIQLLLWDTPTADQWASVFIDGTYEREVDGVKVTKSKNFIQDECMSASNFVGSPLEALVAGTDDLIKELTAPAKEEKPVVKEEAAPEADALVTDDPLKALGL